MVDENVYFFQSRIFFFFKNVQVPLFSNYRIITKKKKKNQINFTIQKKSHNVNILSFHLFSFYK